MMQLNLFQVNQEKYKKIFQRNGKAASEDLRF